MVSRKRASDEPYIDMTTCENNDCKGAKYANLPGVEIKESTSRKNLQNMAPHLPHGKTALHAIAQPKE